MRRKNRIAALLVTSLLVGSVASGTTTVFAEDTYYSELTGEEIDASLKNQRPIAAMVDNESTAYPHYGVAEGDVVYELMNSTANGRITRLMVLVKDWESITQLGSIRSVRSTNIPLAAEWNAVICHDGGPYYVDEYFTKDYAKEHFSGGFTRVDNGKSSEFTEYIMAGDLDSKFASSGYSTEYNAEVSAETPHFQFAELGTEVDLSVYGIAAAAVELPFQHTSSALKYNETTGTYDYYAYGELHQDAEDGEVLTFENVLIQNCDFTSLDSNGYMVYDYIASGMDGYYITNGYAQPITWTKDSETGITRYYDTDGNEITVNRGKTYITMVPSDSWDSLVIQ